MKIFFFVNDLKSCVSMLNEIFKSLFFVWIIYHVNVSVWHLQAIYAQMEACKWETMPYSYDRQLGIVNMHHHINMITHLMNQLADWLEQVGITKITSGLSKRMEQSWCEPSVF